MELENCFRHAQAGKGNGMNLCWKALQTLKSLESEDGIRRTKLFTEISNRDRPHHFKPGNVGTLCACVKEESFVFGMPVKDTIKLTK